ncbi:MAG TPA: hypothetical protein ENJ08_04975 [Gammaproteobacteria bacterium]|nr:hypothetical protein [Gammaproteobacteria bacterium]
MIRKILFKSFVVFICNILVCSQLLNAAQLSLPSGDLIAPEIVQPEYLSTVIEGNSHVVSVNVTDNVAVKQVVLYYRTIGDESYQRKLMKNSSNSEKYQASISADEIKKPGIEYYVQAMDTAGNTLLHGYSFSPLSVRTVSDGEAPVNSQNAADMASAEAEASDGSIFTNKWFWIGVGVLVAGAAAAGGGGGGGGGDPTATLTINAGEPAN